MFHIFAKLIYFMLIIDQYNPSQSLSNETSKCLGMLYSSFMTELTILKNTQFN